MGALERLGRSILLLLRVTDTSLDAYLPAASTLHSNILNSTKLRAHEAPRLRHRRPFVEYHLGHSGHAIQGVPYAGGRGTPCAG